MAADSCYWQILQAHHSDIPAEPGSHFSCEEVGEGEVAERSCLVGLLQESRQQKDQQKEEGFYSLESFPFIRSYISST